MESPPSLSSRDVEPAGSVGREESRWTSRHCAVDTLLRILFSSLDFDVSCCRAMLYCLNSCSFPIPISVPQPYSRLHATTPTA